MTTYTAPTGLAGSTSGLNGALTWNPSYNPDTAPLLLLHFDGTDGQTTTVDSSASANTMTIDGAGTLSTTTQVFGPSSFWTPTNILSVTGKCYTPMGSGAPLDILGTSSWTIETFFNITSTYGLEMVLFTIGGRLDGALEHSMILTAQLNGDGTVTIAAQDYAAFNGVVTIAKTGAMNAGEWHHYALVNNAGLTTIYLDGIASVTTTPVWVPANYQGAVAGANIIVGWNGRISQSTQAQGGYLDEVRISPFAAYTSNFTPPAAPFSALGTPPPGYDVWRGSVSIATFLGTPGYSDTVPTPGSYTYNVFAWDGSADASPESDPLTLIYASSTTTPLYGKFAPAAAYPPTLLINATGIEPQIYMPKENVTVQT